MTSERALWELMHKAIKTYNKDDIFRLMTIKRDLKMANMLKNNISIQTEYDDETCKEYEYLAYNDLYLDIKNEEEYNKIKDWIIK